MSRASTLARVLRELKDERDEVLERKAAYDHDTNRAVLAISRFNKIVEKESKPDERKSKPQELSESPQQPPPPSHELQESEETEANDEDPTPGWAKKAYRLIALRTHPDKINADDSLTDSQRDHLVGLYREANNAYHSKNYSALAEIAAELEINVDLPLDEFERALESKIRSIREEIAATQKTISWQWGISFGDMQKRVHILRLCCSIMKTETPEESILIDIVKELESQPDFDIIDRLGRVRRIKLGVERRKMGARPEKRIK